MHKVSITFLVLLFSFPPALSNPLQKLGGVPTLSISSPSFHLSSMARNKSNKRSAAARRNKLNIRGGSVNGASVSQDCLQSPTTNQKDQVTVPSMTSNFGLIGSVWGSLGVIYFLLNPMKRLLPLALLPFKDNIQEPHALTPSGWVVYALFVLMMAYQEGYKGFQKKFSPMVVSRALSLRDSSQDFWLLKNLLAPLYSMGLIFASKKRLIISWIMVFGVSIIVAICKHIPYPWRSVVDGGVVVGLSWGALAILLIYTKSLFTGVTPPIELYR